MKVLDIIPFEQLASNLRAETDRHSGLEGALFGVGFGIVSALATMQRKSQPLSMKNVFSASMVGLAYGAADKSKASEHGIS